MVSQIYVLYFMVLVSRKKKSSFITLMIILMTHQRKNIKSTKNKFLVFKHDGGQK